jgi:Zn-dependent protease with chaperone function
MYFLLGICLLLALFLALNISASLIVALFWRAIEKRVQSQQAQTRAQIIFALRIFPLAGTLVFIFAFLLPSYFLYEPFASGETVGLSLVLVAALSAIVIAAAFYRVLKTWRKTRQLIENWRRDSRPMPVSDSKIPVYRIEHPFPVVSLVGFFRPRIFISNQIIELLDNKELAAAINHEYGHLKNHDNLKRWLLRFSQDLLIFPIGNRLDRTWSETAETVADEYAAEVTGNEAALDLAAALVKIARIVPRVSSPAMPAGVFLIEENRGDITFRVHNLLQMASGENSLKTRNLNYLLYAGAIFISVFGLAINYNFFLSVHNILEKVVEFFQ